MPDGRGAGRDRRGAERSWGPWTVVKLDALSGYLPAFTQASQRAKRTMFIDVLAGSTENTARDTGEAVIGSAERALQVSPPFSRVVLCERDERKVAALKEHLAQHHPDRDVKVLHGDCNEKVPEYLAALAAEEPHPVWRWAVTFALVDQYSADVRWNTLEALANFRIGDRKTELWIYFGDSFFPRGLSTGPAYEARMDDLFGGDPDWHVLHRGWRAGEVPGSEFSKELVNLMRWKLQHDLGYATTIPLKMVRPSGHGLYHMIFATDHDVGERIMRHVLQGAEKELEGMVARQKMRTVLERQDRHAGIEGLSGLNDWAIDTAEPRGPGQLLLLDPPRPPWQPAAASGD
ncbi:three-Cys-motif partner protein TcmP [Janibacter anophelis]|uniref:three-Cys-motif partner protein TcmP n=1 Tax=Janibacter anophelis TaxID=319054 RepID=UPI000DEFE541|nr:three-Cys-motif partner protein TcmP [Janibacter anophelis]